MAQDILETKWDEVLGSLEAEGLPKEKAKEVLPKAVTFLFEVTRKKKEQYLAGTTLKTRRETFERLIKIAQKYPGVRALLAHLYLDEVKKEDQLKNDQVLQLCEETGRIGIVREWNYQGKESGKWRLAGVETGEVGIPPNVLNAGVHVYDFRSEDRSMRRMRHFLPTDWRNTAEIDLTRYLADQVKQNDARYRAAHPERFAKKLDKTSPIAPPPPVDSLGKLRKTRKPKGETDEGRSVEKPVEKPRGDRGAATRKAVEDELNETT